METITTHSFQEETQPDARFTKVIDGKEIIVRVFFNLGAETMQQKIERMLRMDILRTSKEVLPQLDNFDWFCRNMQQTLLLLRKYLEAKWILWYNFDITSRGTLPWLFGTTSSGIYW